MFVFTPNFLKQVALLSPDENLSVTIADIRASDSPSGSGGSFVYSLVENGSVEVLPIFRRLYHFAEGFPHKNDHSERKAEPCNRHQSHGYTYLQSGLQLFSLVYAAREYRDILIR